MEVPATTGFLKERVHLFLACATKITALIHFNNVETAVILLHMHNSRAALKA